MKKRLLLIEDDRWLADSYRQLLKSYEIDVAADGQHAMDLIDDHRYDLIIADVMLEQGVVIDLLHELQSYADTMNLKVILCTAIAERFALADMRAYGVVAVLDKKTLMPELLRETVEEQLS